MASVTIQFTAIFLKSLRNLGMRVRRGEVVGRAGDSDSLAGSKLYFEMRKDGRSLDPVPWFKKQ